MLGTIRVPVNKRQYFVVAGGPFRECPPTMKGVKMAAEIKQECAVDIPTQDFRVPDKKLLYKGLNKALDLMLAGEPLYVGCMGGKGRTGLFMAVLVKAFGVRKPVEYVREHYYSHAVETDEQMLFVKKFLITPTMRRKVKLLRRWSWLKFWKTNLTITPLPSGFDVAAVKSVSATEADVRAVREWEAKAKRS
jgi:hypothetical protein